MTGSAPCSLMWLPSEIEGWDVSEMYCGAPGDMMGFVWSGHSHLQTAGGSKHVGFCLRERMHFIDDSLKNILGSFEIGAKWDILLCLSLPDHPSSFTFSFFLVSSEETKESIAAGHTGRIAAVLLFRPECSLCKVRKGRMVVQHKSLSRTFRKLVPR